MPTCRHVLTGATLLALLPLLLAACASPSGAPPFGAGALATPSAGAEPRDAGASGSAQPYADTAVQSYVTRVGSALHLSPAPSGVAWTFQVVDDPAPRAYFLPGSYLCVTRGLLALMSTEAELAAELSRQATMTRRPTASVPGGASVPPLDPGDGMILRSEISLSAAVGQESFVEVVVSRSEGPHASDARYDAMLEGLIYGSDPREGTFRGIHFLRADLGIRMEFPEGWMTRIGPGIVMGSSADQDALIELRRIRGEATAVARSFFTGRQVQSGSLANATINGYMATQGAFTALTTDGTTVRGLATFVDVDPETFVIIAYARTDRFERFAGIFERATESFDRLSDPAALGVRPERLRLERVPRPMTLEEFDRLFPSRIGVDQLALLNRMRVDTPLREGAFVKRVVD